MKTKDTKTTNTGLRALVWQEDDIFVAKALEIDIASQGNTKHEALMNLEEAIDLYFQDEPAPLKTIKPHQSVSLERISPESIRYA
jgi:predicted RNase H-like HicB family nuclease